MQLPLKTVHSHSCYNEFSYSEKLVIVNKFQSQRLIKLLIQWTKVIILLISSPLLVQIYMYILTHLYNAIADTISGYM